MRRFLLHRKKDISGVSGTGDVAEGAELHDGQTIVSWFGALHSIEVHPNVEAVIKIHGHSGSTTIVWIDKEPQGISRENP